MMKTKKSLQWYLVLILGCLLGFLSFTATVAIVNRINRSNYVAKVSDVIDSNLKFEEQVLVDNDSYKITVLGMNLLEEDKFNNYLDLRIENHSNSDFQFMPGTIKINDYVVNTAMVAEVDAKESKDVSLAFSTKLKDISIEKISHMELEFRVSNDKFINSFREGSYLIKSNYYGSVDQEKIYQEKNIVEVYNDGKIKMSFVKDLERELEVYPIIVENLTDSRIDFYDSKIEINGVSVSTTIYPEALPPKTKAIDPYDLYLSKGEKDEIGNSLEILRLSLELSLSDPETNKELERYETPMFKVK